MSNASSDRRQRGQGLAKAFVVGLVVLVLSACLEGKPGHNAYLHRTYGDGLPVHIANVDNEAECPTVRRAVL
jgi:hypothetical protein